MSKLFFWQKLDFWNSVIHLCVWSHSQHMKILFQPVRLNYKECKLPLKNCRKKWLKNGYLYCVDLPLSLAKKFLCSKLRTIGLSKQQNWAWPLALLLCKFLILFWLQSLEVEEGRSSSISFDSLKYLIPFLRNIAVLMASVNLAFHINHWHLVTIIDK